MDTITTLTSADPANYDPDVIAYFANIYKIARRVLTTDESGGASVMQHFPRGFSDLDELTQLGIIKCRIDGNRHLWRLPTPDEWPYPAVSNLWHRKCLRWWEVTEDIYIEQLECLPPARTAYACFMVGEPETHTNRGPVYCAFVHMPDTHRFFCKLDHAIDFEPVLYRWQINHQLEMDARNV